MSRLCCVLLGASSGKLNPSNVQQMSGSRPPKVPLDIGDLREASSSTWFLGPRLCPTDRHTDHAKSRSVYSSSPQLAVLAVQCWRCALNYGRTLSQRKARAPTDASTHKRTDNLKTECLRPHFKDGWTHKNYDFQPVSDNILIKFGEERLIMYDSLFILQFQVSTTVMDLVAVFALFVFMLMLLCFCVLPFFRWIKIYTISRKQYNTDRETRKLSASVVQSDVSWHLDLFTQLGLFPIGKLNSTDTGKFSQLIGVSYLRDQPWCWRLKFTKYYSVIAHSCNFITFVQPTDIWTYGEKN